MIESVQRYPNVEYVFTNVPSDVDEPSLKKKIRNFKNLEIRNLIKSNLLIFPWANIISVAVFS